MPKRHLSILAACFIVFTIIAGYALCIMAIGSVCR